MLLRQCSRIWLLAEHLLRQISESIDLGPCGRAFVVQFFGEFTVSIKMTAGVYLWVEVDFVMEIISVMKCLPDIGKASYLTWVMTLKQGRGTGQVVCVIAIAGTIRLQRRAPRWR